MAISRSIRVHVTAWSQSLAMSIIAIRAQSASQKPSQNLSPMLGDGQRWYAVHTLPLSEARAQGHLENQSFRTFLPRRRKTVRHARKMSTVEAPFFPRYLFVALDLTRHQWRRVNGTFGVSRVVMRGDEPCPVPRGVVETLIDSADGRGILQLGQRLKVGAQVRLMAGPFAEYLAILDRLDDCGRVHLLLELMGRQVSISAHCNDVLPLA
jgi:transcription elongation factor/antiterminator RfaH